MQMVHGKIGRSIENQRMQFSIGSILYMIQFLYLLIIYPLYLVKELNQVYLLPAENYHHAIFLLI
jgi:hypothetical protein